MKVSYSAQLMEESVFRHLNHLERSGYRSDYDEFHSLADPIYELPEDDREIAFEKVNRLFFMEKLKLGDHVLRALEAVGLIPKRKRTSKKSALLKENQALKSDEDFAVADAAILPGEFTEVVESDDVDEIEEEAVAVIEEEAPPEDTDEVSYDLAREFEERIREVIVKRAINKVDEGSNVLNRVSGNPIIEMRVLASRFSNPEEALDLDAFLIQEFMHAKDMVDPEFDYEDAFIPGNPSVKNLITSRFRLLRFSA
jgi:aminopeptidase N